MLASKSNYNFISAIILCTLLCAGLVTDTRADVYKHPLKSLVESGKFSLEGLSDKPKVAVICQPDCTWCEKQIGDLDKLQERCNNQFETVIIGARGKRKALKREVKRYRTNFPALEGDRRFLRQIDEIRATPIILFFNNSGELLGRNRGYLPKKTNAKSC